MGRGNGWRWTTAPPATSSAPLADTVPAGHYVCHADQPTQWDDNVTWQDAYLGYLVKERRYSLVGDSIGSSQLFATHPAAPAVVLSQDGPSGLRTRERISLRPPPGA